MTNSDSFIEANEVCVEDHDGDNDFILSGVIIYFDYSHRGVINFEKNCMQEER